MGEKLRSVSEILLQLHHLTQLIFPTVGILICYYYEVRAGNNWIKLSDNLRSPRLIASIYSRDLLSRIFNTRLLRGALINRELVL